MKLSTLLKKIDSKQQVKICAYNNLKTLYAGERQAVYGFLFRRDVSTVYAEGNSLIIEIF